MRSRSAVSPSLFSLFLFFRPLLLDPFEALEGARRDRIEFESERRRI